jgi:Tfp pilus assembly protein PilV
VAYTAEVALCIANERAIVDREGTSREQDAADLAAERARCDAALAAIGGEP